MTEWSSVSLVGAALLHTGKQNGEHSLSVDPLRDCRLEFYRRYLATGWRFSSKDRQSWVKVCVLYGSLCWTWLLAWIKYGCWTHCSTLREQQYPFKSNFTWAVYPHQPHPFFIPFFADTNKHRDSYFQGWENATLPLPVNREARRREKKEGGGVGWRGGMG